MESECSNERFKASIKTNLMMVSIYTSFSSASIVGLNDQAA